MANKLWGKIPNVIEQRLLVTLYQAGRAMTDHEFLELAKVLGLLNVTMNLAGLEAKGLAVRDRKEQLILTPAGVALTKVGLEHNLFATLQDFADLINKPEPPADSLPPPTPTPTKSPRAAPDSQEEKAAQRLWAGETSRAEASRLAQSPKLTAELEHPQQQHNEPSPSPPSPSVSDRPAVTPLRVVARSDALVIPKAVVEQPIKPVETPKPVEVSTPKPVPEPAPKPLVKEAPRRLPPPPPPKFRR